MRNNISGAADRSSAHWQRDLSRTIGSEFLWRSEFGDQATWPQWATAVGGIIGRSVRRVVVGSFSGLRIAMLKLAPSAPSPLPQVRTLPTSPKSQDGPSPTTSLNTSPRSKRPSEIRRDKSSMKAA